MRLTWYVLKKQQAIPKPAAPAKVKPAGACTFVLCLLLQALLIALLDNKLQQTRLQLAQTPLMSKLSPLGLAPRAPHSRSLLPSHLRTQASLDCAAHSYAGCVLT